MDDAAADRAAPVPPDLIPPAAVVVRAPWRSGTGPRARAAALGAVGDRSAWAALARYLGEPRPA
jgi:hypothetical protein